MRYVNKWYFGALFLLVIAAIVGFAPGDRRGGPDPHIAEYANLSKTHADALVVVRFIQKVTAEDEETEDEEEAAGVMIDPSGLVVCSSTGLGNVSVEGVTTRSTSFKVLIGDDTEGVEAALVANDTELDLAWLRIRKPNGHIYKSINPSKSAEVQPGQRLLTLSRLGKFFDRMPEVLEGRASAVVSKPRDLIAPGGLTGAIGDPVFMPDGTFVGLWVIQTPDDDESDKDRTEDSMIDGIMILPAATLEKATQRASRMAVKGAAESRPADNDATTGEGE